MLSEVEKAVIGAIDTDELIDLTANLIRIPSVTGDEVAVSEFIASYLCDRGVDARLDEVRPGRPNVIAQHGGDDRAGPCLLLTGHTDTVPIGDGWMRDPLGAEIAEGRMYGRGASDMKSGIAGMMLALLALKRALPDAAGQVMFVGCIDEEVSGLGTRHAIANGIQADWAIIGEPTDLQPISAAKGNSYYEFDLRGRGAHAGSPEKGANAIMGAMNVVNAVAKHQEELDRHEHPLLGRPYATVSMIRGGMTESAVPDRCTVWVDRRLVPGETGAAGLEAAKAAIARENSIPEGVSVDARMTVELPPMETTTDNPVVRALCQASRDCGAPDLPVGGWTAACDGGFLTRDAKIPTVLFGPGSIVDQAHRPDESVPLSEIVVAARTYAVIGARVLRNSGARQGVD